MKLYYYIVGDDDDYKVYIKDIKYGCLTPDDILRQHKYSIEIAPLMRDHYTRQIWYPAYKSLEKIIKVMRKKGAKHPQGIVYCLPKEDEDE